MWTRRWSAASARATRVLPRPVEEERQPPYFADSLLIGVPSG
jgi:hypothetical protein